MRSLRVAFGLLTTLPAWRDDDWAPGQIGRAAVWFPFVGLLIGAVVWGVWAGLGWLLPPAVAGILALAAWIALTGGLHLDGLADCCDGLLASAAPERRLEIMRDPRLGVFGAVGLMLVLLLKAASLAALTPAAGGGILLATSLARWCVLPAGLLPRARPEGLGAEYASGLRPWSLAVGALIPLALMIALGWRAVAAAVLGLVAAGLALLFARRRIGGVTGDVFGFMIELVETTMLVALLIRI